MSTAEPRARVHVLIRALGVVATLGICAWVFTACNAMAIASWRAAPALSAVVGDRGDWWVSTDEANVNVSPRCEFHVELGDVEPAAIAEVLEGVGPAMDGSDCAVLDVRVPSGSRVAADDWRALTPQARSVIAERLLAVPGLQLSFSDDASPVAAVFERQGGLTDAVMLLRTMVGDGALERALGDTRWRFTWSPEDAPPYHGISLELDGAPDPELLSALDRVADLDPSLIDGAPDADDLAGANDAVRGVQVTVESEANGLRTRVDLIVDDWNPARMAGQETSMTEESVAADAARAILLAFADAGVSGEVVVVANDGLSWTGGTSPTNG
ncbi:hypothetical protein JN535_01280 [Cellulosimicrobium cellulans]|uniref:hypothetical protein n=1 Tax=Cellulosimicrobium cellulans TaxID=1710 RepID=UPI001964A452|nr:hypothetical protein [Cellulosimicrobium cellulans]MBN0038802.1 hypothetical protein [Cellulosimicrobium cellulans]